MKITFTRLRDLEDRLDCRRDDAVAAGDFELAGTLHAASELLTAFRAGNVEVSEIPPAPHRHKWTDGGRCEWPACDARPRKKKEVPTEEGGGSQP